MRLVRGFVVALAFVVGAVVVALVAGRVTGILRLWRIPSSAMEPTLHCAAPASGCEGSTPDRLVTLKYVFGDPKRGDIVAFRTPPLAVQRCGAGGVFVKRIVALPGERLAERNGRVFIDARPLAEPYVKPSRRDSRTIGPLRIPSGRYFLLGDNRDASCDSREWGSVAKSAILGKVMLRYWPVSRFGSP